ncbi:hypothetical protein RXV86_01540 [Alisedimentitalea sp. MJ-SS2]|uniref:hypothetical protein n=1 Tax=Aliisedimentitalea sp. MJ-SS2 TaxID=3049795 RepID=UPI00290B834D|nr:hypothetical protein [Alisedimentitalea sp. MJ-SS2]MDU8926059.1 hypothetical protein [Alisedimentitalea sp. MJ-SS2]
MQGFSVVFFAFWAMVSNLGATLRLTVLPWLIVVAIVFSMLELTLGAGSRVFEVLELGSVLSMPSMLPVLVLSNFVAFIIGCWVGVSWHRHILLREQTFGVLPRRNSEAFKDYFPAALKFAALAFAILLMINWLMIPLVSQLGFEGGGGKIVSILINSLLVTLVLRLGLVLPAAAIGQPISMEDSWDATRGYSGPVFAVALFIVQLVDLTRMLHCRSIAECLLHFIGNWAGMVLMLGALTVLYGVRIQGRRMIV